MLKNLRLPKFFFKNKKNSSTGSILIPDLQSGFVYLFKDGRIEKLPVFEKTQNCAVAAMLDFEDVEVESIEVDKSIGKSELADVVEIKAFESMSLDASIEYKILYDQRPVEENTRFNALNLYVAQNKKIESKFAEILTKTQRLDFVGYAPLLIKPLYTERVLQKEECAAFCFINNESSFLVVYKDGEAVYFKSLKHSIKSFNERFSAIVQERVAFDYFVKLLTANMPPKELYIEGLKTLFSEFFSNVNDILNHAKRISGASNMRNLYITTKYGPINDISQNGRECVLAVKDFDFKLKFDTVNQNIDILTKLLFLSAQQYFSDSQSNLNFTTSKPVQSFIASDAGKFVSLTAASLLICIGYPAYLWLNLQNSKSQLTAVQQKINSIGEQRQKMLGELAAVEKKNSELQSAFATQSAWFAKEQEFLNSVVEIKSKAYPTSLALVELAEYFKKDGVKLTTLQLVDNHLSIALKSSQMAPLTKLLNNIAGGKKFAVSLRRLYKDENSSFYIAEAELAVVGGKI